MGQSYGKTTRIVACQNSRSREGNRSCAKAVGIEKFKWGGYGTTALFSIYLSLIQSPWRWRQHIPPKHRNTLTILRGVITRKTCCERPKTLYSHCCSILWRFQFSSQSVDVLSWQKFYKAHYELSQRVSHFLNCQSSDAGNGGGGHVACLGAILNIEFLVRIPQEKKC